MQGLEAARTQPPRKLALHIYEVKEENLLVCKYRLLAVGLYNHSEESATP